MPRVGFTRSCFLVCLLIILPQAGQAAAVPPFNVSNSSDSTAGSLRQEITDSNSYGGANTISWTLGSGGTISLASDLPIISTNTTLDVTNTPSSVTISGSNNIPLGGAVTFNNSLAPSSWTISAVISGTNGALTQTGAGTLMLTNTNTYGAGTFLNGGILNVASDLALGALASTVSFSGGTLQTAASISSARGIVLGGAGTIDTQQYSSTLSGVISGGGSLTKTGTGILTLAGINTYTGGTILNAGTLSISSDAALGEAGGALTFNGATLQTTTGITASRGITINAGGATLDTQDNASTLSGGIGGSGALDILNLSASTLTLTGSSSYSGGTTINGGTIFIGNSSSLGSGAVTFNGGTLRMEQSSSTFSNAVTINAGGAVIDTLGQNSTLSGVISGVGVLTDVSTGTLTLTGINTYSGTVISSGTLNVLSDTGLGVSTAPVTFNGGVLQAGGDITSSRLMTLNTGMTGVLDTNGYAMTLSGAISGAGALEKAGLGILTLSGANTYSGGTSVNGGTLLFGADNVLGTGAITVNSNATLDMSSYLQSAASYGGAGTLSLMLQPGTTNLTLSGDAAIGAGGLKVGLAPQIVNEGDTFSPIRAGSFSQGVFASTNVVAPGAFTFSQSFSASNLVLTAHFVPFSNRAANANQSAVGRVLEPLRTNATGDTKTVISNLYTLYTGDLQAALDQIGPVALSCMRGVGMAGAGAQTAAVNRRMAALADGSSRAGFSSYAVNGQSSYPGQLLAYAGSDLSTLGLGDSARYRQEQSPWGFYGAAVGSTGRLGEAHSSSGLQPGYAFNTAGFNGGADYRFDENVAAGLSLGYLHGHASLYAPASGTADDNSIQFGAYAMTYTENFHANAYIGGASDDFSTHRGVTFANIARTASAKPQGSEFNLNTSASYDLRTSAWGTYSPFALLTYDQLNIQSFSETGADALDLAVNSQTADSLQSSLGLRYSDKLKLDSGTLIPYLTAGWRHEFRNQSRPIEAHLATGAGTVFSVNTGEYARDGALAGFGFSWEWGKTLTARLDYTGDFRSHYQDNAYTASVRYKFGGDDLPNAPASSGLPGM